MATEMKKRASQNKAQSVESVKTTETVEVKTAKRHLIKINDIQAYNNAYNGRHQRIGDSEGYDIDVYDNNNLFIETLPSITSFACKYNVSITSAWRRLKDGKIINGFYIKERVVR